MSSRGVKPVLSPNLEVLAAVEAAGGVILYWLCCPQGHNGVPLLNLC